LKRCVAAQLEDGTVDHIRWRKPFFRLGISWFIGRSAGQQMSNEFTTPKRPSVAWWMVHRQGNRPVRGESWNPPFFHETIIEPLALMEVVIFQIKTLQSLVCPRHLFRLAKSFEQPQLRGPIDPAH